MRTAPRDQPTSEPTDIPYREGQEQIVAKVRAAHAVGLPGNLIHRLNDLNPSSETGVRDTRGNVLGAAPALDQGLGEHAASVGVASDEGFATLSLRGLLSHEFPATEYLVGGLLPVGGLSLLVAKPKAGKSTLARCLCIAVARGTPFIGRPCQTGTVLYVVLEESLASVQAHFRRLGATGAEPIHVTTGRAPEDAVRALGHTVKGLRPVLVVVDPVVLLTRIRDASAYAEVYRALDPLIGLARETNAHLMLLHHSAKVERGGIDSPLGSTAFSGAVDTLLHLRRREDGTRLLSSTQRNGEDLPETVLVMDGPTGAVSIAGSYAELRQRETAGEMLEVLAEADGPLMRDELFERVEASGKQKADALRVLKETNRLHITGTGVKGDPKRYALKKACSGPSEEVTVESTQNAPESLFSCSKGNGRTGKPATESLHRGNGEGGAPLTNHHRNPPQV